MSSSPELHGAPVTDRRQLADFFAQACRAKEEWRIGTEHEKFPFRLSSTQPVGYDEPNGIRDLLRLLTSFGWREVYEGEHLVGLERGGAAISLEPGGQFELSGSQLSNLHETSAEIDQHLEEARQIAETLDIGFLGLGFHPTARRENIPWMPKARHAIMRGYMPKKGQLGLDMMLRTCTTQVNLDFADEADMVRKIRVATALQPVATALFAASPFAEGKPCGARSQRMQTWKDTDPDRCGSPDFVFEDGFGFERYADYALNVPMYFIYRDGIYIDVAGQKFTDFLNGKIATLHAHKPTMADWANHLGTLFPDVRLKPWLEMRGADTGTAEAILALPSFWTGIMYDSTALDGAWDLVKSWSAEDRAALHRDAPVTGLQTMVAGRSVCDVANDAIRLSQQGLRRRAVRLHGSADETRYLDRLFMITEGGMSHADELLMRYEHFWQGDINKVFEECRL